MNSFVVAPWNADPISVKLLPEALFHPVEYQPDQR
jgi:hypothetical protein